MEVEEVKKRKAKPALEGLQFGTAFTDHMLVMEWAEVGGWQAPRIVPQGPMEIHPGATVLQYAQVQSRTQTNLKTNKRICFLQSVFEGMKAVRGSDNKVSQPFFTFSPIQ